MLLFDCVRSKTVSKPAYYLLLSLYTGLMIISITSNLGVMGAIIRLDPKKKLKVFLNFYVFVYNLIKLAEREDSERPK